LSISATAIWRRTTSTATKRWKRNLQDDYGAYSIWWGHGNSPVLFGDIP
jgi:hypothetical protein